MKAAIWSLASRIFQLMDRKLGFVGQRGKGEGGGRGKKGGGTTILKGELLLRETYLRGI